MFGNNTNQAEEYLSEKEAREARIKELEQEMIELKLANEEERVGVYNDRYEELLKLEPFTIAKGFQEALDLSTSYLRDMSNNQIEELLKYFKGDSPSQKKRKLIQFLKEFGIYRTKDFKKMRNRFFGLKHKGREALREGTGEADFYKYCQEIGFNFD